MRDRDDSTKTKLILSAIIIAVAFFGIMLLVESRVIENYTANRALRQKSIKDSTFCQNDAECLLYDCTSCGNKTWIEMFGNKSKKCDASSQAGLTGCSCVKSVCRREYGER